MRFASFLLFPALLAASDARFTDELWIQVEAMVQQHLPQKPPPAAGLRNALRALAEKAPRQEWREALNQRAAEIPDDRSNILIDRIGEKPFPEALAAILARLWIPWEINKDKHAEATVSQLTRMMNSVASTLDDPARVKQAFLESAREFYSN